MNLNYTVIRENDREIIVNHTINTIDDSTLCTMVDGKSGKSIQFRVNRDAYVDFAHNHVIQRIGQFRTTNNCWAFSRSENSVAPVAMASQHSYLISAEFEVFCKFALMDEFWA